jgi:hypothetical protein
MHAAGVCSLHAQVLGHIIGALMVLRYTLPRSLDSVVLHACPVEPTTSRRRTPVRCLSGKVVWDCFSLYWALTVLAPVSRVDSGLLPAMMRQHCTGP